MDADGARCAEGLGRSSYPTSRNVPYQRLEVKCTNGLASSIPGKCKVDESSVVHESSVVTPEKRTVNESSVVIDFRLAAP